MSGAGTSYRVDLTRLEQTIEDLAALTGALEQLLADADRRVDQVHGVWSGEAAQAHRDAHGRWATGAAQMRQALATMRTVAATSHGNYGQAAAVNARMWSL